MNKLKPVDPAEAEGIAEFQRKLAEVWDIPELDSDWRQKTRDNLSRPRAHRGGLES